MKLTGKCKEDFERWYSNQKYNLSATHNAGYHPNNYIDWFYTLPKSMQYGVYVDFFDSVGIDIEIYNTIHGFDFMIKTNIFRGYFETRPEARTAAIKKANEIHNGK
jgi:hypothetical protein